MNRLIAMSHKEAYRLANELVPTMIHRGREVAKLAKKLRENQWLAEQIPPLFLKIELSQGNMSTDFEKQYIETEEDINIFIDKLRNTLLKRL